MSDPPQLEPPVVAAAAAPGVPPAVKLPQFWPQAPVGWFAQAECDFHTKRMTDSFDKYCHLVAVLPPDTVRLVMDIIEVTPAQQPYETLKERLLSHFKLSEYEWLEKLFTMPELGSRKPSAMLAAMLEVCPRGEEGTRTFAGLFLHRLPRGLRLLLAHEDLSDLKLLAARADALHTHHKGGISTGVYAVANAVVDSEVFPEVNAVASGGGRPAAGRGGGRGGGSRGTNRGARHQAAESGLSRQAREASSLCIAHWRYGQQAYACKQPGTCTWQGNVQAGAK
jgi:hypothetical protein